MQSILVQFLFLQPINVEVNDKKTRRDKKMGEKYNETFVVA